MKAQPQAGGPYHVGQTVLVWMPDANLPVRETVAAYLGYRQAGEDFRAADGSIQCAGVAGHYYETDSYLVHERFLTTVLS